MRDRRNTLLPYVFIVGCPRSGTTLLQRMLDSHPQLAVANDTHFIPRAVQKLGLTSNLRLTAPLVEFVRHYRRYPRLGLPDAAIDNAASTAETYPEFISNIYRQFAEAKAKPLSGEKTPDYVKNLPMLNHLFPEARFIHIYRDGRDVALSTLEWATNSKGPGRLEYWKESPVGVSALWWKQQVSTGREDGASIGADRYLEVCYELLVDQPEDELRRIADFLDLPYTEKMIRFHRGKQRNGVGLSAKSAWRPVTPGLRNWRQDLKGLDLEVFELLAGDLLRQLNYELGIATASDQAKDIASELTVWWQTFLARRKRQHKSIGR